MPLRISSAVCPRLDASYRLQTPCREMCKQPGQDGRPPTCFRETADGRDTVYEFDEIALTVLVFNA